MEKRYLKEKDLKLGMRTTSDQLSRIINTYMILVYDKPGDTEGTLVFFGKRKNRDYDKWFFQNKPITPIYHTRLDFDDFLFDE